MLNKYSSVSYPSSSGSTQAVLDNSTAVATTAYVDRAAYGWNSTGFKDEFLTSAATTITTAVNWASDTLWVAAQIAGATVAVSQNTSPTFTNPGITSFATSATSGHGVYLSKGNIAGGNGVFGALGSNAGWELNVICKIAATTNICVRAGLVGTGQGAGDAPTGGLYMEYDTANTGNTDTKFSWVARSASTSTYSTTSAINADTSFHRFRIRSLVAGTILYSVDGGAEASIATNVPSVTLSPFFQVITRTTGAATLQMDFFSLAIANARA